ncbi:MAG TPA: zinc ribbon domain-containing protein [Candidatus Dormibacteraeota bacterium]|nr:zinc ribbon domain-containing protein [Candidatus Dormibacteraeota bacterium]
MAVQPARYCGRCGAPLPPGATFCGRCGTPVALQAAAAPPMYRYPAPPPAARQTRLAPALIAGGLVVILLLAAVVVGVIAASQLSGGGHSTCTSNCGPKLITPLPEQAAFHSSTYHFTVNYFADFAVRSQNASGIELGTKMGTVTFAGSSGGSADQAIQSVVSGLPSSSYQDVTLVSQLKGAHLGDQDGVGSVYSANLFGASQTATRVRLAVIAATRNGVTVVMFAVNPADVKNFPNGMPEGQLFDYLCTEFSWS